MDMILKIIILTKKFRQKTSYNIISMIILNNYETVISLCTDNHNVILNVSDCSVEKISQSRKNSRK